MKKRTKNRKSQSVIRRFPQKFLFLLLLGIFILFIPGQNIYTTSMLPAIPKTEIVPLPYPIPAPYPMVSSGIFPGSEVTAEAVVIRDVESGVTLFIRNGDLVLSPASTTKILTAMVALDTFSLDQVMTVKSVIAEGQVIGLVAGEQITFENLLYGALIHSGNDAAYAIAENYPGGVQSFVDAMNRKAASLNLNQSHFTNPIGFDDPAHKMTAEDLAVLSTAALGNKTIAKMVAIPLITVSDVTHTYFHTLKNVNQLLGKIPGVAGIKTGWTEEAGENLVTLVERAGHRLIFVVLKSKDRFADSTRLIDWAFANIDWTSFNPPS